MKYELKITQAAQILGVSDSRVSQLISSGAIESTTINGRRRISRESVEAYRDIVRRTGRPPKRKRVATEYMLMNGDYEVLRLTYDPHGKEPLDAEEVIDASRAPWGCVTRSGRGKRREINKWWSHRAIPDARPGMTTKLADLQASYAFEIPFKNLGLSLSDCYWLRPLHDSFNASWGDINYFDNDFLTDVSEKWDGWLAQVGLDSPDNTSEGLLPKRWIIKNGKRVLMKGCRTDDQRPCNEVVATALYRRLLDSGEYVPYDVFPLEGGYACACENFLSSHEEYIPATYVNDTIGNTRGTSTYDRFCTYVGRLGIDEKSFRVRMAKMIVCDSILANIDRHWRNFGFVRDIHTLELRAAPLFDTGNCLWYDKNSAEVQNSDWSFRVKPFGPEPERQLALIESATWFRESALDGFADEAVEILGASKHAAGRLDYIKRGLERRVDVVSQLMRVLAYK